MKKFLFGALLLALGVGACTKSPDDNSGPDPQLSGGKWVVDYFFDKDKVEASNFSGYSFEFNTDGTFMAYTPGGTSIAGTWNTHFDDSVDKLQIAITGASPLDDLNQDWVITGKTDTALKLKDDNTSHLEELHFKKI